MGYNLTIGEAYLDEFDKDDNWRQPVSPSVEELNLDEAPHFPDDMNPGCNYRWPSYIQWDSFCKDAGIHSLFYDKSDGLIRSHPGAEFITPKDLQVIKDAVGKRQKEHPSFKPGWCSCRKCDEMGYAMTDDEKKKEFDQRIHNQDLDPILGRLMWLEWWFDWALKNCKRPTFENS